MGGGRRPWREMISNKIGKEDEKPKGGGLDAGLTMCYIT